MAAGSSSWVMSPWRLFLSTGLLCQRWSQSPNRPATGEVYQTLRDVVGLDSPNILGWLLWSWFGVAVVVAAVGVCCGEPVDSGLSDCLA